jgi:hypothetical protein
MEDFGVTGYGLELVGYEPDCQQEGPTSSLVECGNQGQTL